MGIFQQARTSYRRAAGGGGRARAFRHALKRQRRTTLAPCGGGGDRANFQLQSISMTPDGRAGRTDGRDGGFGGNYRQIMDETRERERRRCGKSVGFQGPRRDVSDFTGSPPLSFSLRNLHEE